MSKKWRPEGWDLDKIVDKVDKAKGIEGDYVEAGADAMLEALKREGAYGKKFDGSIPFEGWSIFIPDKNRNNGK